MNNLVIIAAIGRNGELGKDNQLIWKFRDDMKFFRKHTINKDIVMGRKTLESLPGLLPNRKHIVLTSGDWDMPSVTFFHSKEEVLEYAASLNHDVMIIGGGSIYQLFINDVDRMLLTEIDDVCPDADVFFPKFNVDDWYRLVLDNNVENNIDFKHVKYIRKRSLKNEVR